MQTGLTSKSYLHEAKSHKSESRSQVQTPPPQPTTPLRPPSRSSLHSLHTPTYHSFSALSTTVTALEPAFAELSDSIADLEANFMHLQLMHESLSRFSECFASFLYGMNVNAFCVDFLEAPVFESFDSGLTRSTSVPDSNISKTPSLPSNGTLDTDQTFLTTDTSFVDNPPATMTKLQPSRLSSQNGRASRIASTTIRSTTYSNPARGVTGKRGRSSGLARATYRGKSHTTR